MEYLSGLQDSGILGSIWQENGMAMVFSSGQMVQSTKVISTKIRDRARASTAGGMER